MKAEEPSSITNKKTQTLKRKSSDNTQNTDITTNNIITTTKPPKVERKSLVRTEIFGNTTLLPTTISYNSPILPDAIFLTTSSGQLITTTISPPTPQSNILQEKPDVTLQQQQQQHEQFPNLIIEKATEITAEDVHPNTITRSLNENIKSSQQQEQKNIEEERRGAAAIVNKKKKKNKKKAKPSATQPTHPTSTTTPTNLTTDDTTHSKTKRRINNNNIASNKTNIDNSTNKKKKKQTTTPSFKQINGTLPSIPSDCLTNGFLTTPLTSIAGIIEQVKVARARNGLSLTTTLLPQQPLPPQLPASLPPPPPPQLPSPTEKYIDTSTFLKTEEEQRRDNPKTPTLPTPLPITNNNNNNDDLTTVATAPQQIAITSSSISDLPTTTFVVTNDHLTTTNTKETSLDIQPQSNFTGPAATAFANFPLIASGLTGFAQANFTTFSLQAPLLTPGLTIPLYNSLLTVSAKDGVLPSLNKELFPTAPVVGTTNITTTTTKKTKSNSKKKNNNTLVLSQQNGTDMTTSRGRKRTAQSRLPAKLKEPAAVARRNARERRRVKMVNDGFLRLRRHVPTDPKNKKLSKVKTLRLAIEYIHHLQTLLQSDSTTKQTTQSIVTSFTAQMSNYDDLDDETAEWLQPDSLVSSIDFLCKFSD